MTWKGFKERIDGDLAGGSLVEIRIGRSLKTAGRARIRVSGSPSEQTKLGSLG